LLRLTIDHRTQYLFSEPKARVFQLLEMTPIDYAAQAVIDTGGSMLIAMQGYAKGMTVTAISRRCCMSMGQSMLFP
jgi:hypothetical protein